ncbi:16S rRNA (uracil(1498)-N(3))-methyltransferase [Pueribacillus theae]|uniref:Ribosomal RNA small subunit methyltransferase E n=1 Tax=Pueribacillus theae TaxID=2171751 RepID=A0A2U1K694_9BACI|nr:16S rRNA (uracil(1498)-N(3))-methyltransferase [Pueribacillus theae]PWA12483.1 16S rRNA (uracil(1498)-N(3))-methyltransferase [Pueribacillus theae]
MQRYFVQAFDGDTVTLAGNDARHISRVMRMAAGDSIICSDGSRTARCKLQEITNEKVSANIVEWMHESQELPVSVTIAQGLPKADKLDYIVQKGTELGAAGFLPFAAERSIVKWTKEKSEKRVARLEKIAKEAAEQSHRQTIPSIYPPVTFDDLLQKGEQYQLKIVAYEEEAKNKEDNDLPNVLKTISHGQSILFVVGPEGGFSKEEIEQLKEHHFHICGLGPRILRTETASLYFLAVVSYETELMR